MYLTSSAVPLTVTTSPLTLIEAESLSSNGFRFASLKPIKFWRSTFSSLIFCSICVITTPYKKGTS